jgi:hypothetical protein
VGWALVGVDPISDANGVEHNAMKHIRCTRGCYEVRGHLDVPK